MSSQGNSVIILDDLPGDKLLVPPPKEFWILNLYFFVFGQKKSDRYPLLEEGTFLLIEYPSYGRTNSNKPDSRFWSSPYLSITIPPKNIRDGNVQKILNLYDQELEKKKTNIELLQEHYLRKLGVEGEISKGDHYVEYKESYRDKGSWKCYYIQENYINKIDEESLLNLLDPEGLHHFRYYPIKPSCLKVNDDIHFEGKPLASNITRFINDNCKNMKYLINVDIDKLIFDYDGYILKFDICGSTKVLRKIEDEFKSVTEDGLQYGHDYLVYLGFIMESELRDLDIFQYHIEGDGFLATIPPLNNKIDVNVILNLIEKIIKRINDFVGKNNIKINNLSYQAVVMKGKYNYGRNCGLFSNKLSHMGQAFVTVTRMEQCLKDVIKSQIHDQERKLYFGVSKDVYNENEDCFTRFKPGPSPDIDIYRDTEIKMVILSDTIEEGKNE
jgi:hypothetical protein